MSDELETEELETEEISLNDALTEAWDNLSGEEGDEEGALDLEGGAEEHRTDSKDQSAGDGEEVLEPILPPHSWGAEDKERFKSLPRDAQEVIAKRQADMDRAYYQKTQELSEMRKRYEAFDRIIGSRQKQMALAGEDPVLAIENSLAWREAINENPVQGIYDLMGQFGLTPQHFIQQSQRSPEDPRVSALTNELNQLRSHLVQQQQAQHQGAVQSVQSEIQQFASQTDESGKPRYPYFDRVRDDMVPIVQAIRARDPQKGTQAVLAEAYQAALHINPDTKAALAELEKQKQLAASKERAAKAKAAGSSINGAPNGGPSFDAMPDDIRGALEASWDALM